MALHLGVESGTLSTTLPGFDKGIARQWPPVVKGKQTDVKELKAFSTPMDVQCIRAVRVKRVSSAAYDPS